MFPLAPRGSKSSFGKTQKTPQDSKGIPGKPKEMPRGDTGTPKRAQCTPKDSQKDPQEPPKGHPKDSKEKKEQNILFCNRMRRYHQEFPQNNTVLEAQRKYTKKPSRLQRILAFPVKPPTSSTAWRQKWNGHIGGLRDTGMTQEEKTLCIEEQY